MQALYFSAPNLSAHIARIRGLILRDGESAATVYGNSRLALLIVHDPEATRRDMLEEGWDAEDFPGWTDRGHMADKMQAFIPGVVDGQQEFYHVAPDGTVARWWLTPGIFGPTSHNPSVTDHPLGDTPRPGWHDADGNPLPRDPREATE